MYTVLGFCHILGTSLRFVKFRREGFLLQISYNNTLKKGNCHLRCETVLIAHIRQRLLGLGSYSFNESDNKNLFVKSIPFEVGVEPIGNVGVS